MEREERGESSKGEQGGATSVQGSSAWARLGLRRAPAAQIYPMAGGEEISKGERQKRAGAVDGGKDQGREGGSDRNGWRIFSFFFHFFIF